jgi:hypothetical protein
MLHTDSVKYCYDDIAIVPNMISNVEHREECNCRDSFKMLPIFTAPMSTVVSLKNMNQFERCGIHAIIPRNIEFLKRIEYAYLGKWTAYSLSEFEQVFVDETSAEFKRFKMKFSKNYALIDVANGHMRKIYEDVQKAKSVFKDRLVVMVGNIANPQTYNIAASHGVDYVRVGIGGGSGCITSSNTGVHYPMASLVNEIYESKKEYERSTKKKAPYIVADGGIRNYGDVAKALALGADYVMIGGVLASLLDSAAETYYYSDGDEKFKNFLKHKKFDYDFNGKILKIYSDDGKLGYISYAKTLYKQFYGMASSKGQVDINGEKTKTAEGIIKEIEVTTSIAKWSENMEAYLRSAMSYTSSKTLETFKDVDTILISSNTRNTLNK